MEERINAVFIRGNRDGYHPTQCNKTLTVSELRSILSDFDDDALVYLDNDEGYTYGSIYYDDIYSGDFTEDINEDINKYTYNW